MITNYYEIDGWMNFENIYENAVKHVVPDGGTVVEVGAWLGRSAAFMASALYVHKRAASFFTVDTWKGSPGEESHEKAVREAGGDLFDQFHANMENWRGLYVPLRMTSLQASQLFPDASVHFCFIDAGHTKEDVMSDIAAWRPKIAVGGVLAGHDINWDSVKAGVDASNVGYVINGSSWVSRRRE